MDTTDTQIITGRISMRGALAVRAVTGEQVTAAGQVFSDGTFRLSLPAGREYRLEVMTTGGVRHVMTKQGTTWTALSFGVCDAGAPFDLGGVALIAGDEPITGGGSGPGGGGGTGGGLPAECFCSGGSTPGGGGSDEPLPNPCDPTVDPTCPTICPAGEELICPPPPCDPAADPDCVCALSDPGCWPPPPPPPCSPEDPSCEPPPPPPPCSPEDPGCEPPPPPPCDPTDPSQPNCWVCPATTEGGEQPCWPPPPPPCDPANPESCATPCADDPLHCGCASDDVTCWPNPVPPTCGPEGCGPDDAVSVEHPPAGFGCGAE